MLRQANAFSSFSVNEISEAKDFYNETLGLELKESEMGLELNLAGQTAVFIYSKPNHVPATFTVLNFKVDDIENAVDDLIAKGVRCEQYTGEIQTDEKGIFRGSGSLIAWFKDPAGNILSLIQEF